jgi:hypothetical protein
MTRRHSGQQAYARGGEAEMQPFDRDAPAASARAILRRVACEMRVGVHDSQQPYRGKSRV